MAAVRTIEAPPSEWNARRRFELVYRIRFADGKVETHSLAVLAGSLLAAVTLARQELAEDGAVAARLLSWTVGPDLG